MSALLNHRPFLRRGAAAILAMLAVMGGGTLLVAAPLPPVGKVDITGTIIEARWAPVAKLKGRKGFSGSLGRDRVIPAHFTVTLRDYSGPSAKQAWMMNGFMGVKIDGNQDRSKFPPTLVVRVNSQERDFLKAGMKIRLAGYTVTGDEGGTWVSHESVKILGSGAR